MTNLCSGKVGTVRISRWDSTTKFRQFVIVPATMIGRKVMRMSDSVRCSQTCSAGGDSVVVVRLAASVGVELT